MYGCMYYVRISCFVSACMYCTAKCFGVVSSSSSICMDICVLDVLSMQRYVEYVVYDIYIES